MQVSITSPVCVLAERPSIWRQIHIVLSSGLGPPRAEPEARGLILGERWLPEAGVETGRVRWGREKARARWGTEPIMVPGTAGVPLRTLPRQDGRLGTEPRAALGIADCTPFLGSVG